MCVYSDDNKQNHFLFCAFLYSVMFIDLHCLNVIRNIKRKYSHLGADMTSHAFHEGECHLTGNILYTSKIYLQFFFSALIQILLPQCCGYKNTHTLYNNPLLLWGGVISYWSDSPEHFVPFTMCYNDSFIHFMTDNLHLCLNTIRESQVCCCHVLDSSSITHQCVYISTALFFFFFSQSKRGRW